MPATRTPRASGCGRHRERRLKDELRAELNRARIANRRNHSVRWQGHVGADGSEVRVIEHIERFTPELEAVFSFVKADVLYKREIDTFGRWAIDPSAWSIAHHILKPGVGGQRRIGLEATDVEKLCLRVRRIRIRIAKHIGPVAGDCRLIVTQAGCVKARSRRGKWQTGLESSQTRNLPTT